MSTRDELIKKAEADQEAFIKEYNKLKEEEEAKKQDDLEVKKAILSNKDDKFASEEDQAIPRKEIHQIELHNF